MTLSAVIDSVDASVAKSAVSMVASAIVEWIPAFLVKTDVPRVACAFGRG